MPAPARLWGAVVVAAWLLAGCASEVYREPTAFRPAPGHGRVMLITRSAEATPQTGYPRTLAAGSRWRHVGRIPEGRVYAIEGDVFMVAGRHVHEAYCVVDGSRLVGFFLPVEEAFVPLTAPVELSVRFQQ